MENLFLRACEDGSTNIVSKYIRKGFDVNVRDGRGETGLMKASLNGECDIIRLLLEAGANLNLTDSCGRNALHFAIQGNHEKLSKLLCVNKIDATQLTHVTKSSARDYTIKGVCDFEDKFIEPEYIKQLNGIKSAENPSKLDELDQPKSREDRIYNMIMRYQSMVLSDLESDGDDKTGGEVYKKAKKKKKGKKSAKGKKKSGRLLLHFYDKCKELTF
ncbi:ankyrin repeat [Brachionus plicatilis]|uniref:Ankyrin repeat n=1 Tax=Brachionus plicatilis TaxID=10195 RepID=A0A3M7Q070_BRAPC|nr:ankyrin repeat [Brachionus plicatilis]